MDHDLRVRYAAFRWLAERAGRDPGGVVTWRVLRSFTCHGEEVPLIGARGVWKPRLLDLPISLTPAPSHRRRSAPYDDQIGEGDALLYRYFGTDPAHPDNERVRRLYRERRPLIHLCEREKGLYMVFWPVFVAGDDPANLTFALLMDAMEMETAVPAGEAVGEGAGARRRYITVAARRRLHQASFRLRALRAYRRRCAVCRLAHGRRLFVLPRHADERPGPERLRARLERFRKAL